MQNGEEQRKHMTDEARRRLQNEELYKAADIIIDKVEALENNVNEQMNEVKTDTKEIKEYMPQVISVIKENEYRQIEERYREKIKDRIMQLAKFIITIAGAAGIIWAIFAFATNQVN